MFKRKALEKLKYWKEKKLLSMLYFWREQGEWVNLQLQKNLQSRNISHI